MTRAFLERGLMEAAIAIALAAGPACAQELPALTRPEARQPAGPPPNAVVEQPRAFGHFVGDVLTQRILLHLEGREFHPATLPRPERTGNWLERRALRIETDADRRWLVAEFQVVNAPQALTATIIPAWEVQAADGSTPLRIGGWPISVSPLTPRDAAGAIDLEDLRPDRAAPRIATEPLRRQITAWSGACATTLAFWLAWWLWRQWRASSALPFAQALRDMRRFEDAAPEAWHALHRAFDRTAGHALQGATLPDLFRRAPHLLPQRAAIERFFLQSNERFFGAGAPADPLPVRRLCADLRRIEKRHER